MYKFIFYILTDPLPLPVPAWLEYVVLTLIGEFAFQIAWDISPGGKWGSEIHWLVRMPTYIFTWFATYVFCYSIIWIWENLGLVLGIFFGCLLGTILLYSAGCLLINKVKKGESNK